MTDDAPASWYGHAQAARIERWRAAAQLRAALDVREVRLVDEYGRLWRVLEWDSSGLDESCGHVRLACLDIDGWEIGMTGVDLWMRLDDGVWRLRQQLSLWSDK